MRTHSAQALEEQYCPGWCNTYIAASPSNISEAEKLLHRQEQQETLTRHSNVNQHPLTYNKHQLYRDTKLPGTLFSTTIYTSLACLRNVAICSRTSSWDTKPYRTVQCSTEQDRTGHLLEPGTLYSDMHSTPLCTVQHCNTPRSTATKCTVRASSRSSGSPVDLHKELPALAGQRVGLVDAPAKVHHP